MFELFCDLTTEGEETEQLQQSERIQDRVVELKELEIKTWVFKN